MIINVEVDRIFGVFFSWEEGDDLDEKTGDILEKERRKKEGIVLVFIFRRVYKLYENMIMIGEEWFLGGRRIKEYVYDESDEEMFFCWCFCRRFKIKKKFSVKRKLKYEVKNVIIRFFFFVKLFKGNEFLKNLRYEGLIIIRLSSRISFISYILFIEVINVLKDSYVFNKIGSLESM